jgi:MFS family permease
MSATDIDDRLYRRIALRILPLLGFGYLIAYIDRVNVGFAKLQMSADIGLSSAAYGLGAGIFFLVYCLLEVPSNLVLERVGARVWICRIMVTWGIVTILTGFVQNPAQFYIARVALGAAEAGFFPGVMFLLSQWFPSLRLGRATAVIVMCGSVAGVIVGPVSGLIMKHFDTLWGLRGWQWLFIVQGIPALILGVIVFLLLPSSVASAKWLSPEDRRTLQRAISSDRDKLGAADAAAAGLHRARAAVGDRKVWALVFCMAATYLTIYAVAFWLPTIIANTGISDVSTIGLVSAIPGIAAIVATLALGSVADRTRTHRLVAISCLVGSSLGLAISIALGNVLTPTLIGLSLANGLAFAAVPMIWWMVHRHLGGRASAAAAVAVVNSVASLGSFLGPYVTGVGIELTGQMIAPTIGIACVGVAAAIVVIRLTSGFREVGW